VTLAPPSPAVFLLLALVSLGLALLVRFRARQGALRRYFSLFAVSVAVWLASGYLLYSGIDPARGALWARIAFAGGALLILSLYHVLMLFPDLPAVPFGRTMNCLGVALAILSLFTPLLARDVMTSGRFDIKVQYGPMLIVFTAYAVAVLVTGLHALVRRFRRSSGLRRLQIQYLLLGTVIPVAGVLLINLLLPLVFQITAFAPYGRLLALVFLPLTAHAIIRHRLMDIRLFVRKAVVYGTALAAGAAFFGGLLRLAQLLSPSDTSMPVLESLALATAIAAVFPPVKSSIERVLDRYVYRERHDYPRVLRESSQRMSAIVDAPLIAQYVTDLVSAVLKPERVDVYYRDQSRDAFLPLARRDLGGAQSLVASIPAASPLAEYLDRDRRLLARDEVFDGKAGERVLAAAADLRRLEGELAVAFWHLEGLRGVLIVGAKLSGDPYFAEDLDFLVTLGNQAAVAVANLQLHRQMQDERLRAERLGVIGTLASGVAHEIKNPLVAIRTFAELLPERFQDEDFRDDFSKVVLKEIERIDGLVIRLRELATRPTRQFAAVDLRTPLDETLALLRGQLEKNRVQVSVEQGADVPAILGDVDLLKQLCLNLFMNAIDAMESGGELSIRLWARASSENSILVLEVKDSGTGIPDDIAGQIFHPFFSSKTGGSGLGLAICRSIADAHGARIRARNNSSGKGATFTVEFPFTSRLAPTGRATGSVPVRGPNVSEPLSVSSRISDRSAAGGP